jgi:hypothetical protein
MENRLNEHIERSKNEANLAINQMENRFNEKIQQSTSAMVNQMLARFRQGQTGIFCTIKCSLLTDRERYRLKERRQLP